jgi:hypothetical protein
LVKEPAQEAVDVTGRLGVTTSDSRGELAYQLSGCYRAFRDPLQELVDERLCRFGWEASAAA